MKKYVLTEKQLVSLLRDSVLMEKLDAYGVDNWNGYGMWYDDEPDWDLDEEVEKDLSTYKILK